MYKRQCGSCANVCPGKKGAKALDMANMEANAACQSAFDYAVTLPEKADVIEKFKEATVKGSQFKTPLLEFSGACAGCGETPYAKLITQPVSYTHLDVYKRQDHCRYWILRIRQTTKRGSVILPRFLCIKLFLSGVSMEVDVLIPVYRPDGKPVSYTHLSPLRILMSFRSCSIFSKVI